MPLSTLSIADKNGGFVYIYYKLNINNRYLRLGRRPDSNIPIAGTCCWLQRGTCLYYHCTWFWLPRFLKNKYKFTVRVPLSVCGHDGSEYYFPGGRLSFMKKLSKIKTKGTIMGGTANPGLRRLYFPVFFHQAFPSSNENGPSCTFPPSCHSVR